eukprot:CAMPEP_0184675472 /NCGR_PEP_ID=MMETSP0308-20130426/87803_1 /TAXON_ID=38269 /ORGANISM="Gloeochaete witrockiana, Strain SAG 46.84" /LENGTH=151 /DNA_ID=CAMNT_0027123175 /DNA_START=48 /DNA_END=503 /DNA_ORIENTATION=-
MAVIFQSTFGEDPVLREAPDWICMDRIRASLPKEHSDLSFVRQVHDRVTAKIGYYERLLKDAWDERQASTRIALEKELESLRTSQAQALKAMEMFTIQTWNLADALTALDDTLTDYITCADETRLPELRCQLKTCNQALVESRRQLQSIVE